MNDPLLSRIARSLRQQEENLLSWLRSAPMEVQQLRLGGKPSTALEEHLHVLDDAIKKAESDDLGTCTICHEKVESHLLETNYTMSVCLSHLTGEERSRLEAELELSQKVQKALLPQSVPQLNGWEAAAFSQPASIVGGDYFDFLKFRDGAHAVIIADIMGKGLPASMLMASLQASLRIMVPESHVPHEVLERLNRIFLHNTQLTRFVTVVVLKLNEKNGTVEYANGGHNPPVVVRLGKGGSGTFDALRPTGAAIGLVEEATFLTRKVIVAPGETLFLYTDGVVEARSTTKEEFGEDSLRSYLRENANQSPSPLIRGLRERLEAFSGSTTPGDDTTMVALKRKSALLP